MIFATVGTDQHDFSRLVKELDRLAATMKEMVIVQLGYTKYEPRSMEWFRFRDYAAIEELYRKADLVITHAGAGSIISCLRHGKKPLVVPRLRMFGEHLNDHQAGLARHLELKGVVAAVYDIGNLSAAIKSAGRARTVQQGSTRLASFLKDYLSGLADREQSSEAASTISHSAHTT
ncbi:MAG: beta-1,4-galactosyltransferase [Candidatus Aenigmarchaeota archaeon]|nr:beta-1,4-galactosyltransferase [Candidatus Aenigmarchaeota archaeon]